jgi:hypothetical protein
MYNRISGGETETIERVLDDTTFGGTMSEGTHTVELTKITVGDGYSDITFVSGNEDVTQRFFYQNFDGTDISYLFKQLVASLVEDPQELWALTSSPERVVEYLGFTVNVVLGSNGGVQYVRTPAGFTAAGHVAGTLTELKETLLANGIKLYRREIKEVFSDDSTKESSDKTSTGTSAGESNTGTGRTVSSVFDF